MPYTGHPESVPSDAVRFLVRDTSTTSPRLADEEVSYLLDDQNGDVIRAAARAAEVLAASFSDEADTKQVGPLKLSYVRRGERYSALAQSLWARASTKGAGAAVPYAGGISQSDKESKAVDPDRVPPAFSRRMFDYPLSAGSIADQRALLGDDW